MMKNKSGLRISTVSQVYLIIAMFVAFIFILMLLIQFQMNVLMAVRAYVGAEGMWAKAQKDAVRSIEHYATSRNEDDYKSYLRFIQIPLGDNKSRVEMQRQQPNLDIVREGFLKGGNHPDDVEYMINLFLRFNHISYISDATEYWTKGDQLLSELNNEAEQLHTEIVSGSFKLSAIAPLLLRLDTINQHLTEQENQFSLTLANASRWTSDIASKVTYFLLLIFTLLGIGISWRIIIRIRAIEFDLHHSEDNLRTILNVSPIAVRIAIKQGREVVFCNRSYTDLIQNIHAIGDDPMKYYARPENYEGILSELALGKSVINRQIELNISNELTVWTLASYMPIQYLGESAVLGWFYDISHIKKHEAELSRVAHYDLLTGIPNRVMLADRMKQAVSQTAREQNMMAVCYLDLDGFKPVNDSLGHDAGDYILVEVAKRIGDTIRGGDTVARLGGDEFVILLLGLAQGEECVTTLERILAIIAKPIDFKNKVNTVSASIGVTIYPLDSDDPDTLLRHADQAMYIAKQEGKNRFHIYDPEMDRRARNQNEFLKSIRHALEHNQFELYYQPKVNLRTKKLVGAEALIRWRHPERGLLSPAEFLRQIENTDLDIQIGEWVTATALAQIHHWRSAGLNFEVSINISGYHLESPDFVSKLQQQLANYHDFPFGRLQIEVLETVALNDITVVQRVMESCRKLGVGFALDDFGTGYSSLSYLSSLPVDTIKIDQSFVRGMLEDKGDRAIVQGIIALAKAFERQTVAEGIETDPQYQTLLDMGCELGQGYGIARPMPVNELIIWQANNC
jgi:diguanylate cyclase (GGDEF)-like protein